MQEKNAEPFFIVGPLLATTLDGKTPIIYNAPFDTRVIAQSFNRYGLHTFLLKEQCVDLMRLRQRYMMSNHTVKLGGNHDAVGDCKRMIEIIKEIADADLNPDYAMLAIDNLDACKATCMQIQQLRKEKYQIEQNISALSDQVIEFMRSEGSVCVNGIWLEDGRQATITPNITGVKLKVSTDELPENYRKTSHDLPAIKKELLMEILTQNYRPGRSLAV